MKLKTVICIVLMSMFLMGCGQRVEVPPAFVGKVQTTKGFQEGVRHNSKFRLPVCMWWEACDKLIVLDVSDQRYNESFTTFMPQDDLNLKYAVSMTLAVDPAKYDFIFSNVSSERINSQLAQVKQSSVYSRYAQAKIQTVLPEIVAEFKISEVASNRNKVNEFITKRMREELSDTPFVVKHIGLTQVDYPEIIIKAKENAADRREQENQMLAQRSLDLLAIQTQKEVEEKRREVELMKAKTRALIAEEMMSPKYETQLKYETLQAMAESSNKIIVPTELLDAIAVQNEVSK